MSCYSSSETAPTIDDLCTINGLDWGLGQEGLAAFQCCVCTCIWNSSNFASFVEQYSPRSPYSKGKDDSCSPICGWDSVLAAQQTHLMPVLCNYRDYGEETKAARGKLRHGVQENHAWRVRIQPPRLLPQLDDYGGYFIEGAAK